MEEKRDHIVKTNTIVQSDTKCHKSFSAIELNVLCNIRKKTEDSRQHCGLQTVLYHVYLTKNKSQCR